MKPWDIIGKVVTVYLLARFLSCVWYFCWYNAGTFADVLCFPSWAGRRISGALVNGQVKAGLDLILLSFAELITGLGYHNPA